MRSPPAPVPAATFARVLALVLATNLAGTSACTAPEPERSAFEVTVRVEGDPGVPVAGAELGVAGAKVGTTGATGVARLAFRGVDGETFDVAVTCPAGHRSPARPLAVTLHTIADPSRRPEYVARCPPSTRSVVVAVRAENGPNLPVLHLGREVARTDGSGAAHVLLSVAPDEPFSLVLATTEKGAERLRPQSPSASFVARERDEVLLFDQRFAVEAPKPVVRGPIGPKRLTR